VPGDALVEKFAPNGGRVVAGIGVVVVVAMIVAWATDPTRGTFWVPCLALVIALLLWTSTMRPRVLVEGWSLVLRNMLSTVRIPLAAVDEIAVRQVMAVRAGDKRYVCAGVGRSLRQALRGSAAMRARQHAGGLTGEFAKDPEPELKPGMIYADYVELRIRELVKKDQARRGVARYSPEAEALAAQVRREPAWPEIIGLAAGVVLFVVAIVVSASS
jgi:hypothetical protein